jgi:hypothetical protein
MKEIQIIKIYIAVCQMYCSITAKDCQRLSNNFCPKFSDEECVTTYLWGIANQKFDVTACYEFIKSYWLEWFPKLPAYQNYNRRICNLSGIFEQMASMLITESGIDSTQIDYILDSMPVIVAKETRSNTAKTAGEICDKGYCSSKSEYYYGVKLHALVQKQYHTLPNLFAAWVTPASQYDLSAARQNLDFIRDMNLFADKAYASKRWAAQLACKNVSVVTPAKIIKGQSTLKPGEKFINSVISSFRQPIESFFAWLQSKTNIQSASKVRSANGLLSFIFARISSIFLF